MKSIPKRFQLFEKFALFNKLKKANEAKITDSNSMNCPKNVSPLLFLFYY